MQNRDDQRRSTIHDPTHPPRSSSGRHALPALNARGVVASRLHDPALNARGAGAVREARPSDTRRPWPTLANPVAPMSLLQSGTFSGGCASPHTFL